MMDYVPGLQLPVYSFVFTLRVVSPMEFPNFPGIAFRGAFGNTLKRLVCVLPREKKYCHDCAMVQTCVYARVFESPGNGAGRMRRATHYPHPFVITPSISYPATCKKGDRLQVLVTIFADGDKYFPYFLYTFQEMGKRGIGNARGKFDIEKVKLKDTGDTVFDAEDGFYMDAVRPVKSITENVTPQLKIEFVTPCKIKANGTFLKEAGFLEIMRTAARRYQNISELHGSGMVDIDRENILEMATAIEKVDENILWQATTRFSKRQQRTMPMEGFTGYAVYSGDFTPFVEVLRFAEFSNIGSNTAFGFGSIRLTFL